MNKQSKSERLAQNMGVLAICAIMILVVVVSTVSVKVVKKEAAYKRLTEKYTVIDVETPDKSELKVYDNDTKIVYRAELSSNYLIKGEYEVLSYFADNGLPYRYNEITQKMEKITIESIEEE